VVEVIAVAEGKENSGGDKISALKYGDVVVDFHTRGFVVSCGG
jgi:hypothetical protein